VKKGTIVFMTAITQNAKVKIAYFNEIGFHYNLVADQIYKKRRKIGNPSAKLFQPYIIAGLIAFDMGRMMGADPYSVNGSRFASKLSAKLALIEPLLESLSHESLLSVDLQKHEDNIKIAYQVLSVGGRGSLHQDSTKSFHVGTTKILHFLNPELFIIVDSNAARAFRAEGQVHYLNSTQPGYTPDLYTQCLKQAISDINQYGANDFQALEFGTPITRIYDKLTFITGLGLK
jgi:hypothetical protein